MRFAELNASNGSHGLQVDPAYAKTYARLEIGNLFMRSITTTKARETLYRLVDEVAESSEPVAIVGKRGNAVLVSEDAGGRSRDALPALGPGDARVDPRRHGRAARRRRRRARLVSARWRVVFTRQAQKDARRIAEAGLRPRTERLLALLARNPQATPPPFEKLVGDLAGACSRRINLQHRHVYQVFAKERVVRVLRMWTHYE